MRRTIRFALVLRYADLSRLGHVTRARMTQIMGLSNLAPDIREALLFLPPDENAAKVDWKAQRPALNRLRSM